MAYTGEQKREYQRNWMKARRNAWIESQGGVCVTCGSTEDLEVDHIDRSTKLMEVRDLWSRTQSVRDAELIKCQVLCSSCHLAKTQLELPEWLGVREHGTHGMYCGGCRCVDCKKAHSDLARETRALGKKW